VGDRLFTLDEARALLPVVGRILREMQQRKQEVEELSAELEQLLTVTGGNGHLTANIASAREALQLAATELQALLAELDSHGVELKGIDEGLVDFPALREGRVVNLCWRLGEETIGYWHDLDTGFAGRRPL
jgi:hypothetical protein